MTELPSPLTPQDCDLRDFAFMPLDVQRLKRSKAWLKAKRKPELGFYMVNLWTASWHEKPAGSLEDDDDLLADLAMCDPDRWADLRDEVLHGWIKAADGRLYNPTVAEKANEAWERKLVQRERSRRGNAARWGRTASAIEEASLPEPSGDPVKMLDASSDDPLGMRGASGGDPIRIAQASLKDRKGEGEGEREEDTFVRSAPGRAIEPISAPVPGEAVAGRPAKPRREQEPDGFAEFYEAYPRKDARHDAAKAFPGAVKAAGGLDRLMAGLRAFRFNPERQYQPLPASWLRGKRWEDTQEARASPLPASAKPEARDVDARYFGTRKADVETIKALPQPPRGTPEYRAWENAHMGFPTPLPGTEKRSVGRMAI